MMPDRGRFSACFTPRTARAGFECAIRVVADLPQACRFKSRRVIASLSLSAMSFRVGGAPSRPIFGRLARQLAWRHEASPVNFGLACRASRVELSRRPQVNIMMPPLEWRSRAAQKPPAPDIAAGYYGFIAFRTLCSSDRFALYDADFTAAILSRGLAGPPGDSLAVSASRAGFVDRSRRRRTGRCSRTRDCRCAAAGRLSCWRWQYVSSPSAECQRRRRTHCECRICRDELNARRLSPSSVGKA